MRRTVSTFACVCLMTTTGSAWGTTGHQIIAELAERQLSAAAQQQVAMLLDGATLASIDSWADDVRNNRPETARWHFVDIPREASHYDALRAAEGSGRAALAQPGTQAGSLSALIVFRSSIMALIKLIPEST